MPDRDFVNPYNFVSLQPMNPTARQTPVFHSGASHASDETLYSGRLVCTLIALSPIFIPDHEKLREVTLPPFMKNGVRINRPSHRHKVYEHFFGQEDGIPMIPGTSLKGVIRSVAEAAANGCLAIFLGQYSPRPKSNKEGKGKYLSPFDLEPVVKKLNLQPCSQVVCEDGDPSTGLCPTCRLFGMPAGEEGIDKSGELPNFFAGKVTIGDARLVGAPLYGDLITLTELSTPDPTSYLYYIDIDNRIPRGRKFYYHHAKPYTDQFQARALELIAALKNEGDTAPIFRKVVDEDDGLGRKVTVRPLVTGSEFEFDVVYENLTSDELNLLLYALELDTEHLVNKINLGAYHKIGYGKPAGLGSAMIIVTEWHVINPRDRYSGNGKGITTKSSDELNNEITTRKRAFLEANRDSINLRELRWILRWPAKELNIQYPKFPDDFKDNPYTGEPKYNLPKPGREPRRNLK